MEKTVFQYAALPFRVVDGQMQILLVTSRETKRWILPKGRPEKKLRAPFVAAQEAFEEAGVAGNISLKAIGAFPSFKRLPSGEEIPTRVRVFLLEVVTEYDQWPEQDQRQRQWVTIPQAIAMVGEPDLAAFLGEIASLMA